MKIATSIREIYNKKVDNYEKLKQIVDEFFLANKKTNWHYESRVKSIDSFSLKAETGRFEDISELEDFFGASIVVENSTQIEHAIKLIEERYLIKYKRPRDSSKTHKNPETFVFDDIRLYVVIPENNDRKPKGVENIIFEIQVKTFLQHAWSIATHDLIYKGNTLSWGSSRIAFQVKAMLEHAELSIMESDKLSQSELVNISNNDFDTRNEISNYLKENWNEAALPEDIIRLSDNVNSFMKNSSISLDNLKNICSASSYVGSSPAQNMSPFTAIVLSVLTNNPAVIKQIKKKGKKLFLPREALDELPEDVRIETSKVAYTTN